MSPEQRLGFHQARSGPVMEKLHAWLTAQLEERKCGAKLGSGPGDLLFIKSLEGADAVPAPAASSAR